MAAIVKGRLYAKIFSRSAETIAKIDNAKKVSKLGPNLA